MSIIIRPVVEQYIPIYNRRMQVNNLTRVLCVQGDNNTTSKEFKIYKIFDNVDLSDFSCWMQIQRADGTSYNMPLNKEVRDDYIYITWLVTRKECIYPGNLFASIKFGHSATDSIFQTIPAQFEVIQGIDMENTTDPTEPNILEQAILEVTELANQATELVNEATELVDGVEERVKEAIDQQIAELDKFIPEIKVEEVAEGIKVTAKDYNNGTTEAVLHSSAILWDDFSDDDLKEEE